MEVVKPFFDLCVMEECVTSDLYETTIKRLHDLGFRTIAINQVVDDSNMEPKKKKKKGESREIVDVVPPPLKLKTIEGYEDIKILNRLTVIFENQENIGKILKSHNFKKYHIIAATPMSQQALQFICSTMEADIFSYNPESKANYKLNRKMYFQLIEKGYYFEILYSPAIDDSSKRKNMIAMSHLYHSNGKSKNIIVSSGATNPFHLRSPYDIIGTGIIFGLKEEYAKNAISHCGRNVFLHSVGRRNAKGMVLIRNIEDNSKSDSEDEEMNESELPATKR